MANYRDPKVTNTTTGADSRKGGMSRWIWIALAVILAILLLSWLFGGADEAAVAPGAEDDAVVIEEGAAPEADPAAPAAPAD